MKLNKKIIIITISTILILSIVTGVIILKNINKPVKVADDVIETLEENILAENEFIEESNITSTDEIVNEEINVEDNIEETATNQTQDEVKVQNNSNNKTQISTQTKTTAVESKTQTTTTPTTPVTTTQKTPSQSSSSQTTVVTPSAPKEEFKRNDQMINKIKSIIQNNETDLMKTYGYNIVVDSSIKTLTNQFTFNESRVINSIRNKFGTIRIYAEDCYQNGQFIMTECYII